MGWQRATAQRSSRLVTFLPIYLRAVRGASPAQIGLLMLPMMFGIGIGCVGHGSAGHANGLTAIPLLWISGRNR